MDPGENDFMKTGGPDTGYMLQHAFNRHTPARPARMGDDAVGAERITAVLDL